MTIDAFIALGWTPTFALVPDGARRVIQIVAWTGGTGTAPATNLYLGPSGFTSDITVATDVGGSPIYIGASPPASPSPNQIWIQTS